MSLMVNRFRDWWDKTREALALVVFTLGLLIASFGAFLIWLSSQIDGTFDV